MKLLGIPLNGQKLITLRDIPKNIRLDAAVIQGNEILCTFFPENKIIRYSLEWLLDHSYDGKKKIEV